jgi:hypothetical protein
MGFKRWYRDEIDVDGETYLDLNHYIHEHEDDAIKLFTDEELKDELQKREAGTSKYEKYLSKLNTYEHLEVTVDVWDVLNEVDNEDLMDEVKQRSLSVAQFVDITKKDLRKVICQALDINEFYTDEEIFEMLKQIWKIY